MWTLQLKVAGPYESAPLMPRSLHPSARSLVRLGVPAVQLNMQGRARPAIARLYNWRYDALGDLPSVKSAADGGSAAPGSRFLCANAGFAHPVQLVDVPDYEGRGESTPMPHYYQVRGGGGSEAERRQRGRGRQSPL